VLIVFIFDGICNSNKNIKTIEITNSWATFYWGACAKPEEWAVTYMCVRGIGLASVSTICRLDFELYSDKVSILFFSFYEIEICTVNAVQVAHKHEWHFVYNIGKMARVCLKRSTRQVSHEQVYKLALVEKMACLCERKSLLFHSKMFEHENLLPR
jgi:hypothetical protein